MKDTVKGILRYVTVFFVVLLVLLLGLVAVACIPKSAIEKNVQESAEYFVREDIFHEAIEGVKGSTLDRYADTILVAIAYQYDEENPLDSVMWSSYYHDDMKNENDNLMKAVTEGLKPNQQYLRYWHGSNTILRPLLTVFSIKEIYVVMAVLLGVLIALLIGILIKKKALSLAVCFGISLVMTSVWFVPFSLEYVWNFVTMLLIAIVGVFFGYRDKWTHMGVLFMIGGMVTNYMDFLSTETITFTVPLLLLLWIRDSEKNDWTLKQSVMFSGKVAALWGIGYIGMWVSKWIISSIVLGENVMPYVTEHIGERLGGDIGLGPLEYISGAVGRNLSCVFPFEYGVIGAFSGIALIVFAFYVGYVHYGKKEDKKLAWVYLIVALIPYVRYVILHNHAYLHYFFTYRAQVATILAILLILELLTDRRWFFRGKRKKRT